MEAGEESLVRLSAFMSGDQKADEDMLKEYAGTVLFVSHDRYFIQRIAT